MIQTKIFTLPWLIDISKRQRAEMASLHPPFYAFSVGYMQARHRPQFIFSRQVVQEVFEIIGMIELCNNSTSHSAAGTILVADASSSIDLIIALSCRHAVVNYGHQKAKVDGIEVGRQGLIVMHQVLQIM